jgi:hypothetical protein
MPSSGTTRTRRGGRVPTAASFVVSRMVTSAEGAPPPVSGGRSIDDGSDARTTCCAGISVPPPGSLDEHRPRVSQVSVPLHDKPRLPVLTPVRQSRRHWRDGRSQYEPHGHVLSSAHDSNSQRCVVESHTVPQEQIAGFCVQSARTQCCRPAEPTHWAPPGQAGLPAPHSGRQSSLTPPLGRLHAGE